MTKPEIITDQSRLIERCREWRAAGRLVFDTEFIRDDTYDAALCLIQVVTGEEVVFVDPTTDVDVEPFWDLVTDENVATIVHAGKEDFEVCLRMTGKPPRNVFDVQIAAGFVGYGYPMSLTRLVHLVRHKRIAKGQTLTDWLRRPLTDEQIRYAVEDVVHLPDIYEKLSAKLEQTGRVGWAREEFQRYEHPDFYRPPTRERLYKVKGTRKLDGLGLAVLERLLEWRERWCQKRNRPARAMMRDDVLVEIARRRPQRASELEVLRGFPQARNRRVVKELIEEIKRAVVIPRSEWPEPHRPRDETPMSKAMLDIVSAVTRAICYEGGISHELTASTQRLRELLEHHQGNSAERPALLSGWREQFIGRRLVDLLEGRSELHLSGWPDNPRLGVVTHSSASAGRKEGQ